MTSTCVAVNHLEAHALTVGLTENLRPPYLLLLVSGGHTQLLIVHDVGRYQRLGTTIDDALGEAFDKTAKLLGLGFPGGPAVERAARARQGRTLRAAAADARTARAAFLVRGPENRRAAQGAGVGPADRRAIVADLCAEFEAAVADSVADRVRRAIAHRRRPARARRGRHLVVAGGVAANHAAADRARVGRGNGPGYTPARPAARRSAPTMRPWSRGRATERLARGAAHADANVATARARWPLDPDAIPALGAGRLGAKA